MCDILKRYKIAWCELQCQQYIILFEYSQPDLTRMGPAHSPAHTNSALHQIQQQYSDVQKQQHPFLGTVTHVTSRSNNSKCILKLSKFSTVKEQAEALKSANRRKQLSQKKGAVHILRSIDVKTDEQNQMCGITRYLYSIYEDYAASLGEMEASRSQDKTNEREFPEEEILDMIRGAVNGLLFLCDNGCRNYSFTKESIVMSCPNQNGTNVYKIFDTELAKQMLPYMKILNHIPVEKGLYLAPQTLLQLSNKNCDPDFSLKSQVFTLGMVALEMCMLQPLDNLYNYDRLKLNHSQIAMTIQSLKNYSPFLKSLLSEMLEQSQQERIGAVSLRQKLTVSDNKSTTEFAYSAIGNSNVTQRTHKVSYPSNNIKVGGVQNYQQLRPYQHRLSHDSIQNIVHNNTQELNILQTGNQNIRYLNQGPIYDGSKKNQTFDQAVPKDQYELYEPSNRQKNKSVQKQVESEQRKRASTVHNYPFYYPPNTKPMTVPVIPHNQTPNNVVIPVSSNYNVSFYQTPASLVQIQAPEPIKVEQPLPYPSVYPVYSALQPLTITHSEQTPNLNQMIAPLSKIKQIQIPQYAEKSSQPQTPINNLSDSNMFVSEPLFIKPRLSHGLNQDLDVLNSLNIGMKKGQSFNEDTNEGRMSFESPSRRPKNSMIASNESTPIRKVQALQSHGRNTFNHIIKQTEQQENEGEASNITKKATVKLVSREEARYNGPKTYGKHHFTSGAVYEGQFDSQGNFCGNGILYYPNGKICYSGGWVDNSFHGFGVLNNELVTSEVQPTNYENFNLNSPQSWHHYEGEFCMDKKNGFGTLFMSNGDKFSGCFVRDVIEGYGTFTSGRGERVSGIWNQNILKKL